MKLEILLLVLLVIVSGCTQIHSTPIPSEEIAKSSCIELCKSTAKDLSNGPCLSDDNANWTVSDWVCDVAHSPRQTMDNLPENQCSAYRNSQAHHFVEVDTGCNLIRSV